MKKTRGKNKQKSPFVKKNRSFVSKIHLLCAKMRKMEENGCFVIVNFFSNSFDRGVNFWRDCQVWKRLFEKVTLDRIALLWYHVI